MNKKRTGIFIALALVLAGLCSTAQAVDGVWNKDVNAAFNGVANWLPNTSAPTNAGDIAYITNTITANRNVTITGYTVTNGAIYIGNSGGSFTLSMTGTEVFDNKGAGAILTQVANSKGDTISGAGTIRLEDNLSITNLSANRLTISSGITGSKSVSVAGGTGGVYLNASNAFTGALTLNSGILRAGAGGSAAPHPLGQGALILNGGELQLAGTLAVNYGRNTTVGGDATITSDRSGVNPGVTHTLGTLGIGAQTLTIKSGANITSGVAGVTFGAATLTGASVFNVTNNVAGVVSALTLASINNGGFTSTFKGTGNADVTGAISGNGGLIKEDAGTLTLTGANDFTGGTTISGGTVKIGTGSTTGTLGTGNVTNNATLAFNRSNTLTANNLISGTGSLLQSGAGTLILAGTNSYSGGTTISSGTLQVGNGGAAANGLGSGAVVNNGILAFNFNTNTLNVANNISGSGSLNIDTSANGLLVLSGNNSYLGDTSLTNAARLSVSKDANLGGGANININQNAILTATDSFSTTKTITLSAAGGAQEIDVAAGATLTLNGKVTGGNSGASLKLAGAGTIVYATANDHGATTAISAGTLKLSGTGTINNGNGLLTVTTDGKVDLGGTAQTIGALKLQSSGFFITNGDLTLTSITNIGIGLVSANLHGAGASLVSSGTLLTLTGANDFGGGTTISGGTVKIGNGGNTGNGLGSGSVVNNGILDFAHTNALTLANVISGSGSLTKTNSGILTLSGANTYTGSTTVAAGMLVVNGSLLSQLTTVDNGATLGGTGTVQAVTLNAGSILSAGNSPGTMTFAGNLLLATGSTNIMQIYTDGFDVLKGSATNTITMAGYTLFDFTSNSVADHTSFKVLDNWASGGISTNGATFDFTGLATGQSLDYSQLVSNGLVTVIPEPATIGMLGLGALITIMLRRVRTH